MFRLTGILLSKAVKKISVFNRDTKEKEPKDLHMVQVLNNSGDKSEIIDLADFDNHLKDAQKGKEITTPVTVKLNQGKFLNFGVAGAIQ